MVSACLLAALVAAFPTAFPAALGRRGGTARAAALGALAALAALEGLLPPVPWAPPPLRSADPFLTASFAAVFLARGLSGLADPRASRELLLLFVLLSFPSGPAGLAVLFWLTRAGGAGGERLTALLFLGLAKASSIVGDGTVHVLMAAFVLALPTGGRVQEHTIKNHLLLLALAGIDEPAARAAVLALASARMAVLLATGLGARDVPEFARAFFSCASIAFLLCDVLTGAGVLPYATLSIVLLDTFLECVVERHVLQGARPLLGNRGLTSLFTLSAVFLPFNPIFNVAVHYLSLEWPGDAAFYAMAAAFVLMAAAAASKPTFLARDGAPPPPPPPPPRPSSDWRQFLILGAPLALSVPFIPDAPFPIREAGPGYLKTFFLLSILYLAAWALAAHLKGRGVPGIPIDNARILPPVRSAEGLLERAWVAVFSNVAGFLHFVQESLHTVIDRSMRLPSPPPSLPRALSGRRLPESPAGTAVLFILLVLMLAHHERSP